MIPNSVTISPWSRRCCNIPIWIPVEDALIARGVANLAKCRTKEGTYVYSFSWRYRPTGLINRPQGSLTRTPACDLALYFLGKGIDRKDLAKGVENLLAKRKFARMALHRPIPHESWFAVSGYFYLYGYSYAAEVCRELPDATVAKLRDGMIEEVLATPTMPKPLYACLVSFRRAFTG